MFSSVQAVFVFDVNSFAETCKNESELDQNVAKLKLGCLRLLTEFGAQTDTVRWSCKYYDSCNYKPGTSRKDFSDFNKQSFDDFENELTDRYCKVFDKQTGQAKVSGRVADSHKPHCFILKKSLQEVLLDYNWDQPDISSPVKATRRRSKGAQSKLIPENVGPYNSIIIFTNVPCNTSALWSFCGLSGAQGKDANISPNDFLGSILDPAMVKGFQEDKKICLNFVSLSDFEPENGDTKFREAIQSGLGKLNGGLHMISSIIQSSPSEVVDNEHLEAFSSSQACSSLQASSMLQASTSVFEPPRVHIGGLGVGVQWWGRGKVGRPRKPQPGPLLVWEDAHGTSHIHAQLEVLAVHGSCSRQWGSAVVVGVVPSSAVSVVAVAGGGGHLYVCHAPNTVFSTITHILSKHHLSMILKLTCGGLAVLSPWGGGVACLAVVSASGLATPPLPPPSSPSRQAHPPDPSLLNFVANTLRKCLKAAPPYLGGEPAPTTKRFTAGQTQPWYPPRPASAHALQRIRRRASCRAERRIMQERLQRRYRPQIPLPLAAGEVGVRDLVDVTQPPSDPLTQTTPGPQPPLTTAPRPTLTRAQQLVKKSHIVTAQQKVKEQRAEEEERLQETERRVAQAEQRAKKSQALQSQVLSDVANPQDVDELVGSLVRLRDGGGHLGSDLFTTAQTIINLALSHIRNIPSTSASTEEGLQGLLGSGVLLTVSEINNKASTSDTHLRLCQLHILLHLELLWVLGHSSSSKISEADDSEGYSSSGKSVDEDESSEGESDRGSSIREYRLDEIIRLLRTVSLRHNPTAMANFLHDTVLENYTDTMGEVLVEIYEELNQPLPAALQDLTRDLASVPDFEANSVKSQVLSYDSGGGGGGGSDNPGSGKSREGRRPPALPPTLKEASKRSIVVPKVTRALTRTLSEQPRIQHPPQPAPAPLPTGKDVRSGNIEKARRNLFDLSGGGNNSRKPKLQRSQTVSGAPDVDPKRKKKRRPSPHKRNSHTQRKAHKRNSSTPRKATLLPTTIPSRTHKTPVKSSETREKEHRTPRMKKDVLAPETPGEKIGLTIFNRNRVRKSTGTTHIAESPDVKRLSKTTPRRLHASLTVTRRNSFYSGARSRNWERARTQLLADHLRGSCDLKRSASDSKHSTSDSKHSTSDSTPHLTSGDASFLFSEIISANASDSKEKLLLSSKEGRRDSMDWIPEKKTLNFGCDDDDDRAEHLPDECHIEQKFSLSSDPQMKQTLMKKVNSIDIIENPVKNVNNSDNKQASKNLNIPGVKKTPVKKFNTLDIRQTPVKKINCTSSLGTPSKLKITMDQSPAKSLMFTSPGQENDFIGFLTPRKEAKLLSKGYNQSSRTHNESPGTPLHPRVLETPSKRVQFTLTLTPSKSQPPRHPHTPRGKDGCATPCTPKSILKTPSKTPVKTPVRTVANTSIRTPAKTPIRTPTKTPIRTPVRTPTKTPVRTSLKFVFRSLETSPPTPENLKSTPVSAFCADQQTPVRRTSSRVSFSPSSKGSRVSRLSFENSTEGVPETPPKNNSNSNTPVKVDHIVAFSESEIELVSPSKQVQKIISATSSPQRTPLKSSQTKTPPFKVHPIKHLMEKSPQEIADLTDVDSTSLDACTAKVTQSFMPNVDEDSASLIVHSSEVTQSIMPCVGPEDIEMVSSIMFGSDFDSSLVEVSEDEELPSLDLNGLLSTLSSPQKNIRKSPVNINSEGKPHSPTFLPDKQCSVAVNSEGGSDSLSFFLDKQSLSDDQIILTASSVTYPKEMIPGRGVQSADTDSVLGSVSPEIPLDPRVKISLERLNLKHNFDVERKEKDDDIKHNDFVDVEDKGKDNVGLDVRKVDVRANEGESESDEDRCVEGLDSEGEELKEKLQYSKKEEVDTRTTDGVERYPTLISNKMPISGEKCTKEKCEVLATPKLKLEQKICERSPSEHLTDVTKCTNSSETLEMKPRHNQKPDNCVNLNQAEVCQRESLQGSDQENEVGASDSEVLQGGVEALKKTIVTTDKPQNNQLKFQTSLNIDKYTGETETSPRLVNNKERKNVFDSESVSLKSQLHVYGKKRKCDEETGESSDEEKESFRHKRRRPSRNLQSPVKSGKENEEKSEECGTDENEEGLEVEGKSSEISLSSSEHVTENENEDMTDEQEKKGVKIKRRSLKLSSSPYKHTEEIEHESEKTTDEHEPDNLKMKICKVSQSVSRRAVEKEQTRKSRSGKQETDDDEGNANENKQEICKIEKRTSKTLLAPSKVAKESDLESDESSDEEENEERLKIERRNSSRIILEPSKRAKRNKQESGDSSDEEEKEERVMVRKKLLRIQQTLSKHAKNSERNIVESSEDKQKEESLKLKRRKSMRIPQEPSKHATKSEGERDQSSDEEEKDDIKTEGLSRSLENKVTKEIEAEEGSRQHKNKENREDGKVNRPRKLQSLSQSAEVSEESSHEETEDTEVQRSRKLRASSQNSKESKGSSDEEMEEESKAQRARKLPNSSQASVESEESFEVQGSEESCDERTEEELEMERRRSTSILQSFSKHSEDQGTKEDLVTRRSSKRFSRSTSLAMKQSEEGSEEGSDKSEESSNENENENDLKIERRPSRTTRTPAKLNKDEGTRENSYERGSKDSSDEKGKEGSVKMERRNLTRAPPVCYKEQSTEESSIEQGSQESSNEEIKKDNFKVERRRSARAPPICYKEQSTEVSSTEQGSEESCNEGIKEESFKVERRSTRAPRICYKEQSTEVSSTEQGSQESKVSSNKEIKEEGLKVDWRKSTRAPPICYKEKSTEESSSEQDSEEQENEETKEESMHVERRRSLRVLEAPTKCIKKQGKGLKQQRTEKRPNESENKEDLAVERQTSSRHLRTLAQTLEDDVEVRKESASENLEEEGKEKESEVERRSKLLQNLSRSAKEQGTEESSYEESSEEYSDEEGDDNELKAERRRSGCFQNPSRSTKENEQGKQDTSDEEEESENGSDEEEKEKDSKVERRTRHLQNQSRIAKENEQEDSSDEEEKEGSKEVSDEEDSKAERRSSRRLQHLSESAKENERGTEETSDEEGSLESSEEEGKEGMELKRRNSSRIVQAPPKHSKEQGAEESSDEDESEESSDDQGEEEKTNVERRRSRRMSQASSRRLKESRGESEESTDDQECEESSDDQECEESSDDQECEESSDDQECEESSDDQECEESSDDQECEESSDEQEEEESSKVKTKRLPRLSQIPSKKRKTRESERSVGKNMERCRKVNPKKQRMYDQIANEMDDQENIILNRGGFTRRTSERKRREEIAKNNQRMQNKSVRTCRRLISSLREPSSDEESDEFEEMLFSDLDQWKNEPHKRIFDDDSDFISPAKVKKEKMEPREMPLKNVENLPTGKSEKQPDNGSDGGDLKEPVNDNKGDCSTCLKSHNLERRNSTGKLEKKKIGKGRGDIKEPAEETKMSVFSSPIKTHSPEKCRQQTIDKYLSSVSKTSPSYNLKPTPPPKSVSEMAVTRKHPEIPGDFKIMRRRHGKRKISDVEGISKKSPSSRIMTGGDDTGYTNDAECIKTNSNVAQSVNTSSDFAKSIKSSSNVAQSVKISPNIAQSVRNVAGSVQTSYKKGKKKHVKMVLTKSGEHYQVSETTQTSLESSDHNTSEEVSQHLSSQVCDTSNLVLSLDSSNASSRNNTPASKNKSKKKTKDDSLSSSSCYITPHRFTRHMSRDLSITPEVYQRLITLSPEKKESTPIDGSKIQSCSYDRGGKLDRELAEAVIREESKSKKDSLCSVQDSSRSLQEKSLDAVGDEWLVQNLPDSPTLKMFIRKQKSIHSLNQSLRVEISPLHKGKCRKTVESKKCRISQQSPISKHSSPVAKTSSFSDPSLMSLVHLAVSPILNDQGRNENSEVFAKPRSSRRLYKIDQGGNEGV